MADLRKLGSASNIVRLLLTKSTDGTAFTGASNSSSGLIVSTITDNESSATAYTVAGSNVETIVTLGTWSAPTTGKCRIKEVDATNHPGLYELHFSDSRFSVSNAKRLLITISGVTGLFPAHYEIQLTQADVYDAVRLGLTGLPNAAAGAVGGLPLSVDTSGRVDVLKINGTSQTARDIGASVIVATNNDKTGYSLTATTGLGNQTASITGNLSGSVGSVTAAVTVGTINANVVNASALATDAVAEIQTGLSTLDAAGVRNAVGLATANLDTQLSAINTKTINLPSDPADASDIAAAFSTVNSTLASVLALIDTEIAAIKAKTDGLPADTAASLTTLAGYVDTLETELAKVLKTGEQFTATDGTGSKNVTFTRV